MVRPDEDDFDEDEDDRRPLTVEELDAEHQRLTASWSSLERFSARVGIIESLTVTGRDLHSTALGKYDVTREVARGGMGVVFEALDRELGRAVALKLWYEPTGAPDEKIRREAMNLARLNHPNVVVVHEVDRVDDLFYMAMELVRGQDMRARLAESLGWREAVRLFIEAGRGLAAAHEAGLVHGDFKPENVLVGADGRVRVADFGVARALWTEPSEDEGPPGRMDRPPSESPMGGTPAYMAPERLESRRGDARSDQFSLCVALWEAIFGQRPFTAETELGLWVAITEREPQMGEVVVGIPARLVAALRRGLAPRPGDRFASMVELLDELEDCLAEPERARQRRRARISVAASVLTGLALGTVLTLLGLTYTEARREAVPEHSTRVEPPFATVKEVAAAFRKWQTAEPSTPSRDFANQGVELAAKMESAADFFAERGDHESHVTTLVLAEVTLFGAIRHYRDLGLEADERMARIEHITMLRTIQTLTGSDESAKIESDEARLVELESAGR